MNDFINDIIKNIENLNQDKNIKSTGEWTIAVKKALIDVAYEHDLSVCSRIPEDDYKGNEIPEWMYDSIIYKRLGDVFNEVYLVCESEWDFNIKEIIYDFEKLLFARSKARLIVFQVNEEKYLEYKNTLINIIEKSASCLKGDIYLFAIFHLSNPGGFVVEKYVKG
jgi:hypothetical protein